MLISERKIGASGPSHTHLHSLLSCWHSHTQTPSNVASRRCKHWPKPPQTEEPYLEKGMQDASFRSVLKPSSNYVRHQLFDLGGKHRREAPCAPLVIRSRMVTTSRAGSLVIACRLLRHCLGEKRVPKGGTPRHPPLSNASHRCQRSVGAVNVICDKL